jgi:hypothetical protein
MDSIRGFKKISFREIEQAAFRIACKTQIKAMRVFLEDLDEEIYKNRDKKRYESVDRKDRTIETILGIPVTFKRRYYKDRKADNYTFLLDEALGLPKRSKQSPLAREIAVRMAVDGPSYRIAICCKIKVEKVASENSIVLQLGIPQYCKSPLQA